MCWLAGTCTRQTPGSPSTSQTQTNQSAENTPPKPTTAPSAAEEKAASPQGGQAAEPKASAPAATQPESSPAAVVDEQAAPTPEPSLILPAGTVLTVRTNSEISAKSNPAGTRFQAVVAQEVTSHGRAAIPAGATVTGVIVQAKQGGKIKGASDLALQLTSLQVRGASYSLHTNQFVQQQKGKGERTTKLGLGGAAGGAVIGGIAGGGKGAAVGSLLGGGAGVAGSALTGNKELKIPAESLLSFKLTQALRMSRPKPETQKETNP